MKKNMPRTPFSTPLSGSAKVTELRIKNIISGPKKRPPVLFLALIFAVCIFCGNLVSCQVAEAEKTSQPGDVSIPEHPPELRQSALAADYQPRNEVEYSLLQALFQSVDTLQPFQDPTTRLLDSIWGEDYILGAALVEDHLENTLILGVMDRETQELAWSTFHRSLKNGAANVVTFQNYDGKPCLLYTFNGQENGQYTGQAGVLRFDDSEYLNWIWPVEGDARLVNDPPEGPQGAFEEYEAYWNSRLALLAPGGVDVYTVNPEFEWGKDEPASMWQLETGELFYYDRSSAAELPMPVYFQALQWLNGYTRDSGGWRVTGLVSSPDRSPSGLRQECFTLWAQTDDGSQTLTADLFFPFEPVGSSARSYDNLSHAQVRTEEIWQPVRLDIGITPECLLDEPFELLTEEETSAIKNLDPRDLPREAVENLYNVSRQDCWQDLLLPLAYDEACDVTLYGVVGKTSDGGDAWLGSGYLPCYGIVLRYQNRAEYFPLFWGGNGKYSKSPLLLVDDFDSDGRPEAAAALFWGWGTGAWSEALYIFDLDTMTYTLPDYSQVPLEITVSPDGKTARLASGDQEFLMDITELTGYFDGEMGVGNVIRFRQEEGKLFCELGVDFTNNTLGYMAEASFPVVYENGAYRLGPAAALTNSFPG